MIISEFVNEFVSNKELLFGFIFNLVVVDIVLKSMVYIFKKFLIKEVDEMIDFIGFGCYFIILVGIYDIFFL